MNASMALNLTVDGTTVTLDDGVCSLGKADFPIAAIVSVVGNELVFTETFKCVHIRPAATTAVFVAFGGAIAANDKGYRISDVGDRIEMVNDRISLAAASSIKVTVLVTN